MSRQFERRVESHWVRGEVVPVTETVSFVPIPLDFHSLVLCIVDGDGGDGGGFEVLCYTLGVRPSKTS